MSSQKPVDAVLAKTREKEARLTLERLKELLHYDPETGLFTRKALMCGSSIGSVCGSWKPSGYVIICVDRTHYRAHRLAWFYVHGTWPPEYIDHINQKKDDNRIANLRLVSRGQNTLNTKTRSDNALGVKNVILIPSINKFEVKFTRKGDAKVLGYFDSLELAEAAARTYRSQVQGEYGCHG